jgi:hypothetical protein
VVALLVDGLLFMRAYRYWEGGVTLAISVLAIAIEVYWNRRGLQAVVSPRPGR